MEDPRVYADLSKNSTPSPPFPKEVRAKNEGIVCVPSMTFNELIMRAIRPHQPLCTSTSAPKPLLKCTFLPASKLQV